MVVQGDGHQRLHAAYEIRRQPLQGAAQKSDAHAGGFGKANWPWRVLCQQNPKAEGEELRRRAFGFIRKNWVRRLPVPGRKRRWS
jgi:hypothetical protein